jgi:hypothetical protein
MAAGFRSPFFLWIGGISAPGGSGPTPPPDLCDCPDYKQPQTLTNAFTRQNDTTCLSYTKPATLANGWIRKACDG